MEHQYHQLLEDILKYGQKTEDRTGTGTISIFGYQCRYDLSEGFPAVTTKKLAWKAMVGELLWMLEGSTDERRLAELTFGRSREELVGKRTIWTDNADNQGKALGYTNNDYQKQLGPVYGHQWRYFSADETLGQHIAGGVDQIQWLVNEIRTNPTSRRLILTAWNPMVIGDMALPPCHYSAQFSVRGNKLSCLLNQRSGDAGLGIPFNIASYSLLIHLIAPECGLEVGEFIHSIGDAHIYLNHIDPIKEQLKREPFPLPTLEIDDDFDLVSVINNPWTKFPLDSVDKFRLLNYEYHPTIKMEMAV
jgi:thymidylate synthase